MRIGSDIVSLQAQHALERTSKAFARALQRLASGKRINSAGDDAAGLAISTGLDSQVRGLKQATRNINDAFGFLSTAEGAIATQVDITQRMRELAMQAANGTYSDQDRDYLNSEFQSLLEEFNRVAEQTNFNGTVLLDGNFETKSLQVGTQKGQDIQFSLNDTRSNSVFPTGTGTVTTTEFVADGTFQNPITQTLASLYYILPGDFNGDGKVDLISSSGNTSSYISLGNGNGTFQSAITVGTISTANVANLNNDAFDDVVGVSGNEIRYFISNGDGTFQSMQTLSITDPSAVIAGDVDGDGDQDLAVQDRTASVLKLYRSNGDGTFQAGVTFAASPRAPTKFVDLNHDGKLDLVIMSHSSVTTMIGNGDGTFAGGVSHLTAGGESSALAVADVNGDQNLDLIETDNSQISVLLGNGNGTFQGYRTLLTDASSGSVVAADLNADGNADLVSTHYTPQTLAIWISNGDGSFQERVTKPLGSGPRNSVIADFNGDGVNDIGGSNSNSASAYIFIGNTQAIDSVSGTPIVPLDITTQSHAQNVLGALDSGLSYLNEQRAKIGAYQSRLESAANVTSVTVENLSQARSEILDTDFAEEAAELTKQQILQQAGVSVMAQAQLQMQMVLSLLKNL